LASQTIGQELKRKYNKQSGGKVMVGRLCFFVITVATALVSQYGAGLAQEPYYKGKVVRIMVGASAGGLFDPYSRLLARHLHKHVPGDPTFIVENVPGAGGLIAANRMYKAVKPDGLTMGHFNGGLAMGQVVENPGIEFDAPKFQWVGVPARAHTVCVFTKASGITSIQRWMSSPRPVKLGATGPGSNTHDVPKVFQTALPLPIQLLAGYKGVAEVRLAAEAGELDGICMAWEATLQLWAKAVETGEIVPVLQAAPRALPQLPSVPLAIDIAKNAEAKRLIEVGIHDMGTIVLSHALPPGTPKEPVQIIRQGFWKTLSDPEFLAEAKKANLKTDPVSGQELEKIVTGLFRLEPELVTRLKTIFGTKN
jgi:tripartite-type tricarboxylate transporter receptor subunit TctC